MAIINVYLCYNLFVGSIKHWIYLISFIYLLIGTLYFILGLLSSTFKRSFKSATHKKLLFIKTGLEIMFSNMIHTQASDIYTHEYSDLTMLS